MVPFPVVNHPQRAEQPGPDDPAAGGRRAQEHHVERIAIAPVLCGGTGVWDKPVVRRIRQVLNTAPPSVALPNGEGSPIRLHLPLLGHPGRNFHGGVDGGAPRCRRSPV